MKPAVAVVAVLAVVGSLAAQETSAEQRIADVIDQLEDEGRHDSAFHRLVAMGEPAVRVIRSQIEEGEYSAACFKVLGEIGPDAADTFTLLSDSITECPPETLPALLHALHSLWVFLPDGEHAEALELLRDNLLPSIPAAPDVATRRELADVLSRNLSFSRMPLIHANTSIEVLVEVFSERRRQDNHQSQLAAKLLGRMGAKARSVIRDLVDMMKMPIRQTTGSMLYGGGRLTFNGNPPSRKPYAKAILSIDPNGAEAVEAHVYLVEHGDSHERQESVRSLGVLGEPSVRGISSLSRIARDPNEKDMMRFEAITTIGMIGPSAASAIPTLTALSYHDDRQIAERAKAALRQIRR